MLTRRSISGRKAGKRRAESLNREVTALPGICARIRVELDSAERKRLVADACARLPWRR